MKSTYVNFYPTPVTLIEKMVQGIDFDKIKEILEPEAGKGDIVDYLKKNRGHLCRRYDDDFNVDCVEIVPDLRAALTGKGHRVVGDDFLLFDTYKHYDLIIMNPPFDAGATHLLKALKMQKDGGIVVCLLNAETLRNPCDNQRKELVNLLERYEAEIEYLTQEFASAERTTLVEVALVKVTIPERTYGNSIFFNEMKKSILQRDLSESGGLTDVAVNDYLKAVVQRFEIEVAAGMKLIREYKEMSPYILSSLKQDSYKKPILELKVDGESLSENNFLKCVRRKYWSALFNDERFTKGMPSDIRNNYCGKVNDLVDYDFSYYNIKEIQIQMKQSLIGGIEESILNLFHELTDKHSWGEFSQNIHYYNGWATNKAWYVGKKVILPAYDVFCNIFKKFQYRYAISEKLRDIEKALDYLKGTPGRDSFLSSTLAAAESRQESKNIETMYFTVTFYKKGTMHIVFKDEDLIKRLNIYAGRKLNMLPPCYGKKAYEEMTREEKDVIDSFEGKESYQRVYEDKEKYLFEVGEPMIGLIEGDVA